MSYYGKPGQHCVNRIHNELCGSEYVSVSHVLWEEVGKGDREKKSKKLRKQQ